MKTDKIYNMDCMDGMQLIIEQVIKVDLIITDPPYLIRNTTAGGKSPLSKSIQYMNDEIRENGLTEGITEKHLRLMLEVMERPNIYIWCNGIQIPWYLDFFVKQHNCTFDILVWHKTNAMPLFYNKLLTDKEYVLYFRRGGYCQPINYGDASTVYTAPLNTKDKKKYEHPTIKPLPIIERLVRNSSRPRELILDPFAGTGTTLIAARNLNRRFIGFELEKRWYDIANLRLGEDKINA